MLSFRFPLALSATLAFQMLTPTAGAQPAATAQITVTDITSPVIAGDPLDLSFDLSNTSGGLIDKVVAAVQDPKGRDMTPRNLYTRDIQPGATVSGTSRHAVPSGSLPGTYRVQVQALTAAGAVVGTASTEFVVLNFSESLEREGLRLAVDDMPAQVGSGERIRARVSFTNHSSHIVDRVYAMVVDPNGRILNARGIYSGAITPGRFFERTHGGLIPDTFPLGTYRVQFQARCDDGTLLASTPMSFEVTAASAGLRAAPSEPLSVFPNPAADRATLRFALASEAGATLAIYDALGRMVQQPLQGAVDAGQTDTELDVSGFAPGLYVARLAVADGTSRTTRFTVAR